MYGNASLSFYDPALHSVENQIFIHANNIPLGDVCHSMSIHGKLGFLAINNSGKVFVINTDNFQLVHTIGGLVSPRYIEFVSDTKAYITDLYSPYITIIHPTTFEVTGSIPVTHRGTEQMAQHGDYLYVTSWTYNDKVYKIDTRTDNVVDSLTVTKQPNSIVCDRFGKLWVLSDGSYPGSPYGKVAGALTRIDAESFTLEATFPFSNPNASPTEIQINGTRDTLYYINSRWDQAAELGSGICRMAVTDSQLNETPFIPEAGQLFYALGVDPKSGEIYTSDAIDYLQKGFVLRYSPNGQLLDKFKVDITPGAFAFKP